MRQRNSMDSNEFKIFINMISAGIGTGQTVPIALKLIEETIEAPKIKEMMIEAKGNVYMIIQEAKKDRQWQIMWDTYVSFLEEVKLSKIS